MEPELILQRQSVIVFVIFAYYSDVKKKICVLVQLFVLHGLWQDSRVSFSWKFDVYMSAIFGPQMCFI